MGEGASLISSNTVTIMAAAITSRTQALLSRQYVDIVKVQLESYLSVFLTYLDRSTSERAYIESETVRFVYQPVEDLCVLLITRKSSNIVEDLSTIKLLAQIVHTTCPAPLTEAAVDEAAFDLIFAFDEVLSYGFRENVTPNQVKMLVAMDSHEEKLHALILENKANEEKEKRTRIAMKLDKERRRQMKRESVLGTASGIGSNKSHVPVVPIDVPVDLFTVSSPLYRETKLPGTGMQLGNAADSAHLLSQLADRAELLSAPQDATPTPDYPVIFSVEEKLTCTLESEGDISQLTVHGSCEIVVNDSIASRCTVLVDPVEPQFTFKNHPFLCKNAWLEHRLQLKDDKTFSSGIPLPLLKWRLATPSPEMLPFALSCWPAHAPNVLTITVEIEPKNAAIQVENIKVVFPLNASSQLTVVSCDIGELLTNERSCIWDIPKLHSNATLEFSVAPSAIVFPFTAIAERSKLASGFQIRDVLGNPDVSIPFSVKTSAIIEAVVNG